MTYEDEKLKSSYETKFKYFYNDMLQLIEVKDYRNKELVWITRYEYYANGNYKLISEYDDFENPVTKRSFKYFK